MIVPATPCCWPVRHCATRLAMDGNASSFYVKPRLVLILDWMEVRRRNAAHIDRVAPLLRDLHLRVALLLRASSLRATISAREQVSLMLGTNGDSPNKSSVEYVRSPASSARCRRRRHCRLNRMRMTIGGPCIPIDCHLTPGRLMAAPVAKQRQRAIVRRGGEGLAVHGKSIDAVTNHRVCCGRIRGLRGTVDRYRAASASGSPQAAKATASPSNIRCRCQEWRP
jgi:hypothetical protein